MPRPETLERLGRDCSVASLTLWLVAITMGLAGWITRDQSTVLFAIACAFIPAEWFLKWQARKAAHAQA